MHYINALIYQNALSKITIH